MFSDSPSEDSGSQARRSEAAVFDFSDVDVDEEVVGRESAAGFCCMSAI